MRNSKSPAFLPVDHRANFSGYRTKTRAVPAAIAPWPVRRRIGMFVLLALGSWIVALSPLLLID